LTKTDDLLLALSRTIPEYIQEVGVFQYKGKTYRLVDNFASSQYMKCGVCGNYPIFDVSVIRSEDGDRIARAVPLKDVVGKRKTVDLNLYEIAATFFG